MKIEETRFEDYIKSAETNNIFPELETYFAKFPKNISDLKHIIFYGPIGNGKYTQSLMFLKKYSDSNMKYEKKIIIERTNQDTNSFMTSGSYTYLRSILKDRWNILNEFHTYPNMIDPLKI